MNKIEFDFNKKNEIPYVKINREPTAYEKLGEALSSYAKKGVVSVVEKVAEEIAKCKDYERAMEFTKGIGLFLKENGVTPIISEIEDTKMTENAISATHVVHFEGLDFSEHDKVLEDKIELLNRNLNLQKDKRCEVEIERNYFAEQVNQLKSENEELKQRIAELESLGRSELPFDPLECANYLINSTYERETNGIERTFHNLPEKVNSDRYTVDDLEQIAEHLLVYCKHNKESE